MSDAIPPDGVIAQAYATAEETLTDGARRYMRDCLVRGMRGEQMPEPKAEYELNTGQKVHVRQRSQMRLPEIERVRAGELPLSVERALEEAQDVLPF